MIRWQQWVLFASGCVVSSFMTALLSGFSLDSPDLPKFMSKVAMGCAIVIPMVGLGLGICGDKGSVMRSAKMMAPGCRALSDKSKGPARRPGSGWACATRNGDFDHKAAQGDQE